MAWGEVDVHRAAAAQRLEAEFGELIPPDTIDRTLEESYERWSEARITMYVPVLAERAARDQLRHLVRRKRPA